VQAMRLCSSGRNRTARCCLELRKAVERGVARGGDRFGVLFYRPGRRDEGPGRLHSSAAE
jgi:hypothetical protein